VAQPNTIKGILFDAGDTLLKPKSGHWFVPPNFDSILDDRGIESPDLGEVHAALGRAARYLDDNHSVQTIKEEFDQFVSYYNLVFEYLELENRGREVCRALAHDMVYNEQKFDLFDDTLEQIERFYNENYRLGIVSDTWPSLERVFDYHGLLRFFETFTISSRLGCLKPDERMFRHPLEALGLAPECLVFVDNASINVEKAEEVGMRGVLIHRYDDCAPSASRCITTLDQLDAYL